MKIGIFTDSYKPYTSGVVTSIVTFKEELEKLGHSLYIFAPSYPNYSDVEDGVYRFLSVPSPTNSEFSLAIPVLPGMNMLLRRMHLDIIHVHSPFTMGRVGLHYARRYHIPIMFTYHTLYDQYVHYVPVAQDLAREMAIKFSNHFCNQCDHIVVPTTEVEEILKGYEIKTPVSVIPTGVPLHKFKAPEANWLREWYPIPAENQILLFVGRLSREKNLEFLLEAFNVIKSKMPNTTLVLTASGPLEQDLKNLAASLGLSLEEDVIFTGAVPFDTLVQIYYASDLFVFSSMTETQGLVLVEAMAAGLPVVAIRAYGVCDMVNHGVNGILTGEDREEFAEAVVQVLKDPKIYGYLKQNALSQARSLSSENMALRLEEIYRNLCGNGTHRRPRMYDWISRIVNS